MGQRVRNVMSELHGEKIDIVDWSEDPAELVAHALSPARVTTVEVVDAEARSARVIVPDFQLSLAIGKEGQNARLAARLTGWRIDIRSDEEEPSSEVRDERSARARPGRSSAATEGRSRVSVSRPGDGARDLRRVVSTSLDRRREFRMRLLGVLGGMSWTSTETYYRLLNTGVAERLGGLHSARLLLHSVDFDEIAALQHAGDWDAHGRDPGRPPRAVSRRPVPRGCCWRPTPCTRSPTRSRQASGLPLLHIADATAAAVRRRG